MTQNIVSVCVTMFWETGSDFLRWVLRCGLAIVRRGCGVGEASLARPRGSGDLISNCSSFVPRHGRRNSTRTSHTRSRYLWIFRYLCRYRDPHCSAARGLLTAAAPPAARCPLSAARAAAAWRRAFPRHNRSRALHHLHLHHREETDNHTACSHLTWPL